MIRASTQLHALLACFLFTACASTGRSNEDARTLVSRFVEAGNAHDYDKLDSILTPDFTRHSQATPDVQVRSRADMKRFLEANAKTFPDELVTIERMTVEGDRVAFRGTYSGTQEGAMGPFPITKRSIQVDISGEFLIEGEQIAELWILWDNMALLGQLGLWPPADAPDELDTSRGATRENANKALARVWFDDVITGRNLDAINQHYASDYVHHGAEGAELRGVQAARQFAASLLAASSDRVAVVNQQVAESDIVVTRFTSRGTHSGTFRGVEPTGKEWVTEGICISRIEDGKIAEDWEIVHVSGL
jgi:steroid delta-isomerase-like uncharacterized protein